MIRKTLLLIAVLATVAAACADGDATDTTVPATLTTTSSTAPETTTTAADTTTSVAPGTTTTVADTTTTAPTTTTTMVDATVELTGEGIQAGPTWVHFGYDADDAVDVFDALFGPPTEDTGWLDSSSDGWEKFGVCPGPNVRGVRWGDGTKTSLQLLFTDGDTDFWTGGVEHFFTFYYFDGANPEGLMTPEGIGVGSSVGQLKDAYEGPDFTLGESFFDPSVGAWSYGSASWTGLWGFTTGLTDAFVVTSVNGGQGCGE